MVVSVLQSHLKYKAVIFLPVVEHFICKAEEIDISTFSHFQQDNLMLLKVLFKGLFSGVLKNILYSQFLLSLMFSLHLSFSTLPAPTAITLSSQQKSLVDNFFA